jgi:purine-binding chemotaxis protein CheW
MVGMRWRRDYVRELVRRDDGVVLLPDLPTIFQSLDGPHPALVN